MSEDDSLVPGEGAQAMASPAQPGGVRGTEPDEPSGALEDYSGKRAMVSIHIDDQQDMTFACPLTANTIYGGLAEVIYNLQQLAEQQVHDAKARDGIIEPATGPMRATRSGEPFMVVGEVSEDAYLSLAKAEPRIETSIDQTCSWCGEEWDDVHMQNWMCPTIQRRTIRPVGPVSNG